MKSLLTILSLCMFNMSAIAGGVTGAKIAMVQSHADGSIYVFFDGGTFSAGPCAYPINNKKDAHFKLSGLGKKDIYASALTAMTTSLTVTIGGTGLCEGGYETVDYIRVQQPGGFVF